MEEWRKGWHPERMKPAASARKILVVGAGPTGLSAAHRLGLRGYEVALSETNAELGGRVARECRLPGLSAWGRVRDYRQGQIEKMPNVAIYRESKLTADDVFDLGFSDVAIATGSMWRRDGVARYHTLPINIDAGMPVFTPDDVMDGKFPSGHVMIYDDDHYYMGSVLAELLVAKGCRVSYVTPSAKVSEWSLNTLEQGQIQRRLLELGVEVITSHALTEVASGSVTTVCTYTGRSSEISCDGVLLVTARLPNDELFTDLMTQKVKWADSGIESVVVIGDAQAPAAIAWATYAGHRYAEEFDMPDIGDALPYKREVAEIR
jgi:dimethylamine/trimethylamine dehydrogenase